MTNDSRSHGRWKPSQEVSWTHVLVFCVVACGLAWVIDLPLWLGAVSLTDPLGVALIAASMYTPTVAAFLVLAVMQRRRGMALLTGLGWVPLKPARRWVWLSVIGMVGSILLPVLVTLLAAALGFIQLDLAHFSGFEEQVRKSLPQGSALPMPIGVLVALQFAAIPFAALTNALLTAGEETGWRGFLLPALRPLGTWPALLISGGVWGLWHAPIILLGYNFAEPNLLGLGLMVLGCVAYGLLVGWLRIVSGNIWPSVFAHGAFNAAGSSFLLLMAAGTRPDLINVNPLGWIGAAAMFLISIILAACGRFPRKGAWAGGDCGGERNDATAPLLQA